MGFKIFLGIVLVLCAILSIKATVVIKYSDELTLMLKVLFLKIKILPKKKKVPKISDGKPKKVEKRLKKLEKQKEKKRQKAKEKAQKKKAQKAQKELEKQSGQKKKKKKKSFSEILGIVKLITAALGDLFKSFGKHLRIKFARLHITVATGDAAKTATSYGAMCAAVTTLVELLEKLRGFSMDDQQISVNCDFLEEKSYADVHIEVGLRVWHVFAMLFSAIKGFIRQLFKNMSNKSVDTQPTENKNPKNNKINNQLNTK